MSDKKICFLIQPPGLGGLSVYHDRLHQLLERKHKVDLFVITEVNLANILDRYDIVQLFFTPLLSPQIIWHLLRRKGTVFAHYYNIKNEPPWKLFLKSLLLPHTVDGLIFPSSNMVRFYENHCGLPKNKLHVIPPPTYLGPVPPAQDSRHLSYIGSIRRTKGVDRLFTLARHLPEPIHLSGIWSPNNPYTSLALKLQQEKKIVINTDFPAEALMNTSVLLLPYHSLEDTYALPLTLLESLSLSVPVLTSPLSPLTEILPEEFICRNWDDPENVKKKIELLKDKKMKKKAKQTFTKLKTAPEEIAERLTRLYAL